MEASSALCCFIIQNWFGTFLDPVLESFSETLSSTQELSLSPLYSQSERNRREYSTPSLKYLNSFPEGQKYFINWKGQRGIFFFFIAHACNLYCLMNIFHIHIDPYSWWGCTLAFPEFDDKFTAKTSLVFSLFITFPELRQNLQCVVL